MAQFLLMPLKIPPRYDLVEPLAQWLDGDFQVEFGGMGMADAGSDQDMQWVVPKPDFTSVECRSDLKRLAALRNCLSEALQDSHKAALEENALRDCYEYHATLLEFQKRGFPSVDDDSNGVSLCWKGAFATSQKETHHTLVWDRACTLWNAAALLSSMIQNTPLDSKENCKLVVGQCQTASTMLSTLCQMVESEQYATADLCPQMIQYWEQVFLAQGQVCIYKLANLGTSGVRNHSTLAYLSKAASNLYNDALKWAQDSRLQSEVPKQSQEWGTHCKANSMIFFAKAEFHLALHHQQSKEWGMELARLAECVSKVNELTTFCTTAGLAFPQVEGLAKLAKDRYASALTDNRQVYQDSVPKEVAEIRAQQMVKAKAPLPEPLLVPTVNLFANVK
jgi:hypothetical protein